MLQYEHPSDRVMPQLHPPRKFKEYSISSSSDLEGGRTINPIFIGLDTVSKKSRTGQHISIFSFSQMLSSTENDEIDDPERNFSDTSFFSQKDYMSSEETLNLISEGIDNIFDSHAQLYSLSNDLQSLRDLSIQLATQAKNSTLHSSLIPFNSSKQSSNIKLVYDSYNMISKKLKLYTINSFLKNDISYLESVSEIGQSFKSCQIRVNLITYIFSPLCLSKLQLKSDFDEIFEQTIEDVFSGKKTISLCIKSTENYSTVNVSSTNSFGFNDSNVLDSFTNPFNGFGSGCNSNDFNNALTVFQGIKNDTEHPKGFKEEEEETNEELFELDFDGNELFEKVSHLIIRYFIENVIFKKPPISLSLHDETNDKSEADLTSFYYGINNKRKEEEEEENEKEKEKIIDEDSIRNDIDFINAFHFIKKTGSLYESRFIPTLIEAIINEYNPIVQQLFDKSDIEEESSTSTTKDLTFYFSEIRQIEAELDFNLNQVSFLLSDHSIEQIKVSFRQLVFASKLDEICKNGLHLLVQKKDIKTIELCADFAKSTNIIQNFALELSFDIESVVGDCFKGKILNENNDSNPIRESIDYLNLLNQICISSFTNAEMKKTLQDYFKKGLNVLPDQAARMLAEEVNFRFLHLPSYTSKLKTEINKEKSTEETDEEIKKSMFDHLPFLKDLINIFRLITCKDVFEAYYHLNLSRRVFMLKASVIQADEFFASLLRETCGPEYTKRIDTIFHDLHHSSRALSEFQEEETRLQKVPPCYFKALVLNQSSWITNVGDVHQTPIETPPGIREVLSDFAQFYLSRNPNKGQLEWNHHFSRVKLSVRYPSSPQTTGIIREIQCNGIAATILCLFNNHENLTKKEIIDLCKGSEKIIDECIKVLKSKKNGKILKALKIPSKSGFVVDLNSTSATDVANSAGIVKLPFIKMILPKSQTDNAIMHIDSNRAQVIDANVMLLLKRDHSMDKQTLKDGVKELIQFRLDDELFEKELENLSRKLYLRLDPSGRVHYLP